MEQEAWSVPASFRKSKLNHHASNYFILSEKAIGNKSMVFALSSRIAVFIRSFSYQKKNFRMRTIAYIRVVIV